MFKKWFQKIKTKTENDHARLDNEKKPSTTKNFQKIEINNYSEVVYVLRLLEQQRKIILSLVNTSATERRRIVDFLSGFIYAKKSSIRSSGNHTYILILDSK